MTNFYIGMKVMQPSGKVGTIVNMNNDMCLVWNSPQEYGFWYDKKFLQEVL